MVQMPHEPDVHAFMGHGYLAGGPREGVIRHMEGYDAPATSQIAKAKRHQTETLRLGLEPADTDDRRPRL